MLHFSAQRFLAADLKASLNVQRQFDLAVSVEVAEHLPARCAETFIQSLCRHAPVVLFSAAIPYQGGNNHLNEQWPEYWATLFSAYGYMPVDCIRKRIWNNPKVEWWYSQNILVFATIDWLSQRPALYAEYQASDGIALPLVHPRNYLTKLPENISSRQMLRKLTRVVVRRLQSRLGLSQK